MWCWRQQRFHHWTMDLGNQPLMQWQHLCSGIWTSRIVMTCLSQPYHGNLLQIFECNLASWIIIHNDSFLKMCSHTLSFSIHDSWLLMIIHDHPSSFMIIRHSWLLMTSHLQNAIGFEQVYAPWCGHCKKLLGQTHGFIVISERGSPQEFADHFWAVMYRRKLCHCGFSRWHSCI